jgi:hypothetical protein
MRRALLALSVAALAAASVPTVAAAQSMPGQQRNEGRGQNADGSNQNQRERQRGPAPLRGRVNAGPCPYVKILYDAARYVELADNRAASANVGFTGEIEGVTADCSYREDEPITVDMNLLFNLGRGPQAQGDSRTYRYWVAVTERNQAVLSKQYIDLPVNFEGRQTAAVEDSRTVVIPRASVTTSGSNFEILVGFDVTPQMAEFNRNGSRFRINAGAPVTTPPTQQ